MPARLLAQVPPLPFAIGLVAAWLANRRWPLRLPRGRAVGAVVLGAGLALDGWSIATQLRAGSSPMPSMERSTLVTSGPYAVSRNPIYVAHSLVTLGLGLTLLRTAWALAGVALAWAATDRWTVPFEEEQLRARFGQEYESYSKRVGRWIGPPR